MARFTDCEGRDWQLRITLGHLAPLRDAGFSVVDPGCFAKIDDPDLLGKVLWLLCEDQAADRKLSPEAILDSGIRPSDLEKLAHGLARAGPTVQKFVNDFHDAPGFERVLLSWAKRHYWNTKLKKPAWTKTQAWLSP